MTSSISPFSDACKYFKDSKLPLTAATLHDYFTSQGYQIKYGYKDGLALISHIDGSFVVDIEDDFRVLVRLLPETPSDRGIVRYCMSHMDDYDVFRAINGTMVTINYCPRLNRWLMSTTSMYDATNLSWIGPLTWKGALLEAGRTTSGMAESWFADIEKGPKENKYVIIFRHHGFHPLLADPMGIWQVAGQEIPGMPKHLPIALPAIPAVSKMREECAVAANETLAALKKNAGSGVPAHYGYVFRRKKSSSDGHCQYAAAFFESSLHKMIRDHMYDEQEYKFMLSKPTKGPVIELTPDTRATFFHVRAYLNLGMYNDHRILFPQSGEVYAKMDFIMKCLDRITKRELRANQKPAAAKPNDWLRDLDWSNERKEGVPMFGNNAERFEKALAQCVRIGTAVGAALRNNKQFNAFTEHITANIRDTYMDKRNIVYFMSILAC